MHRPCHHCGEVFDDARAPVCPHCGADADFTHADPPDELGFDDPRMDDDAYAGFLREEGLAGRPPRLRAGCAAALLATCAATLALLA